MSLITVIGGFMNIDLRYTKEEELANALTHQFGAILAIVGIIILIFKSNNNVQMISSLIYGITLYLLFQVSTIYHAIVNQEIKNIFQKIDHSAIYLLIAGTYTPILLLTVKYPLSIGLLVFIWILAISGIIYSCLTVKFKYLSTGLYLLMGWMSVLIMYEMWHNASPNTVFLLLLGGLFFSVGCIFYLSTKKYMHSIWHIFVIIGAIAHYFSIIEILKTTSL